MPFTNSLVLSGTVCREPKRLENPAGIPYCHWTMEHRSTQCEADFNRQVYCVIQVAASGETLLSQISSLTKGSTIKVCGFLSYHQSRNGNNRLVLHAQSVELI